MVGKAGLFFVVETHKGSVLSVMFLHFFVCNLVLGYFASVAPPSRRPAIASTQDLSCPSSYPSQSFIDPSVQFLFLSSLFHVLTLLPQLLQFCFETSLKKHFQHSFLRKVLQRKYCFGVYLAMSYRQSCFKV